MDEVFFNFSILFIQNIYFYIKNDEMEYFFEGEPPFFPPVSMAPYIGKVSAPCVAASPRKGERMGAASFTAGRPAG
ncbi:MAG: hypothetical protein ACP5EK_00270 [Thermoplasmatota archaeon]